jgi:hypothetical protein
MMFDFVQHSLKAVSDCQRDMSIVSICQRPGALMRFLMQSAVSLGHFEPECAVAMRP